jgi:hypothetical protein
LHELLLEGILTQDEYDAQKKIMLDAINAGGYENSDNTNFDTNQDKYHNRGSLSGISGNNIKRKRIIICSALAVIVIAVVLIAILVSNSDQKNISDETDYTAMIYAIGNMVEGEVHGDFTPIYNDDVNEIMRDIERHIGELVRIKGTVMQPPTESESSGSVLINISEDNIPSVIEMNYSVGLYDNQPKRILEYDKVVLYGQIAGIYYYETTNSSLNSVLEITGCVWLKADDPGFWEYE